MSVPLSVARGHQELDVRACGATCCSQPHFARAYHSILANGASWARAPERYGEIPMELPVHLIDATTTGPARRCTPTTPT